MAKRYWALVIKRLLLSLAVVFCIGIATSFIWDKGDLNPLISGIIAIAIYLLLSGAMLIVGAITNLIYLWLFADKDLSAAVVEELRAVAIPAPNEYDFKNFSYLETLASDESARASDRVNAAMLLGAYTNAMSRGVFMSLALRKAIDDGILRYSQEAPPRKSGN